MITDIQKLLQSPFPIDDISWLPGATTKEKDKCLALAYADLRAYQNRLDDVFGMDWAVSYTPWGDRIICHVTINGITRSSTGEPDAQSNKSEIGGTASEAQAFKRACAMFGLGRYLYNLPQEWVPFDGRAITKDGKKQLDNMYSRFLKSTPLMVDVSTGEFLVTAQNGAGRAQNQQQSNHTAQHRTTPQRPVQPAKDELDSITLDNAPPVDDSWDGIVAEVEANRVQDKKAKAKAQPFVWPVNDDALEICAGLANSPDCPGRVAAMITYFDGLHAGSGDRAMSDKQYGFLTSLLDKRYNGGHNAVLSALIGYAVNSDHIPGWKVKELIDWLKDEATNAQKLATLDSLVDALKVDLQQLGVA